AKWADEEHKGKIIQKMTTATTTEPIEVRAERRWQQKLDTLLSVKTFLYQDGGIVGNLARQLAVPVAALGLGLVLWCALPKQSMVPHLVMFFGAQSFVNIYMKAMFSDVIIDAELKMRGFQEPWAARGVKRKGECFTGLRVIEDDQSIFCAILGRHGLVEADGCVFDIARLEARRAARRLSVLAGGVLAGAGRAPRPPGGAGALAALLRDAGAGCEERAAAAAALGARAGAGKYSEGNLCNLYIQQLTKRYVFAVGEKSAMGRVDYCRDMARGDLQCGGLAGHAAYLALDGVILAGACVVPSRPGLAVRLCAAEALGALPPAEGAAGPDGGTPELVVAALGDALRRDASWRVQVAAAQGLGALGQPPPSALPLVGAAAVGGGALLGLGGRCFSLAAQQPARQGALRAAAGGSGPAHAEAPAELPLSGLLLATPALCGAALLASRRRSAGLRRSAEGLAVQEKPLAKAAFEMVSTPKETYEALVAKGTANAGMPFLKLMHSSIMGGAYVGMAGLLSLTIAGNLSPDVAMGVQKMVFAALFPVNLLLVLQSGCQLYTGNTATVSAAFLEGKVKVRAVLRSFFLSWVGNVIGCGALAVAAWYTGLLSGGTGAMAAATVAKKVSGTLGQKFVKAILCNWLVCMAVFLCTQAKDMTGKMVGIWVADLHVRWHRLRALRGQHVPAASRPARRRAHDVRADLLAEPHPGDLRQPRRWGRHYRRRLLFPVRQQEVRGALELGPLVWLIFRSCLIWLSVFYRHHRVRSAWPSSVVS
ncbi:unnamed protein product, partial [Prorocentrum cordatum]